MLNGKPSTEAIAVDQIRPRTLSVHSGRRDQSNTRDSDSRNDNTDKKYVNGTTWKPLFKEK